jgi:4'-phosphopantetheinyl transferase
VTGPVRVWVVAVDVPAAVAARCREVLDASERARAAAFVTVGDQQRFTVAHGALRILAGHTLGTPPAALSWTPGRHGKPGLAAPWAGLHTSLSHSQDMIALAISTGRPVGVDIQHQVPGLDVAGLSARFFAPDEAQYVAAGRGEHIRADRFAQLWARKEAVVKAAGGRLWPNLRVAVRGRDVVSCADPASPHRVAEVPAPASLYRVADVPVPASFRGAVALAGPAAFSLEVAGWPAGRVR